MLVSWDWIDVALNEVMPGMAGRWGTQIKATGSDRCSVLGSDPQTPCCKS